MAKAIGPSFPEELAAAGLTGLPFAWGADGTFSFGPQMVQAQVDQVLAVYAAHNPITPGTKPAKDKDREDVRALLDAASKGTPTTVQDLAAALLKVI